MENNQIHANLARLSATQDTTNNIIKIKKG